MSTNQNAGDGQNGAGQNGGAPAVAVPTQDPGVAPAIATVVNAQPARTALPAMVKRAARNAKEDVKEGCDQCLNGVVICVYCVCCGIRPDEY